MLSKKAQNLKTSPTLFLVAKAKELQSQGHDVISLTVGEPDWPTFEKASLAGIEAIQKGITKYTPANGTIELRKAIAAGLKKELNLDYTPNQAMVSPGAKFAIFSALQMICDPGDEVIIHTPYWVSYPTMIELSGGVPKVVACGAKENFKITADQLEKSITSKTKGFLFCSPSNPTGLVYTKEELSAIAKVFLKYPQVIIISDDIYNRLMFDGSYVAPHLLHVAPELKERTVVINGGSKTYSMTGWRIGWAAGPEKLIKAMGDYQSQATGSPSSISQNAALAALNNSENEIKKVVETLIKRKKSALEAFSKIPEFKIHNPDGAFYLWVDITKCLGKSFNGQLVKGSKEFCDILLNQFFVATVPGNECGSEGFMRLSFATTEEKMNRAIDRMKEFVGQLK